MQEDTAEHASARGDLCRLLAACWYEPDAALVEERVFEQLVGAAGPLAPALADGAHRVGQAYAAHDPQVLLVEYQRLFAGPGPLADPHESSWRAGDAVDGEQAAMALEGLYQAGGFTLEEDEPARADHLAIELEFLWLLIGKEDEARRAGLADILASWQSLSSVFLRQHLGAWIGSFAEAVQAHDGTAFYRELALLTSRFVAMESAARPLP